MLLVGFPVHEFATRWRRTDSATATAKLFGRLTLNPIVHFDPLGGILLAVTFIASAGVRVRLGQADAGQPDQPRGRAIGARRIVAAAGPSRTSSWRRPPRCRCATSSPTRTLAEQIPSMVLQVLFFFVFINLVLMVFNLFPIPPLDGSKVLFAFLPPQLAWHWRPVLEQYGFVLLLLRVLPAARRTRSAAGSSARSSMALFSLLVGV